MMLIFRFKLLFWISTVKCLLALIFKNHIIFHKLSIATVQFSVCLLKAPNPKSLVCSDWSALTGLNRLHLSALQVFYLAEGVDSIVLTSQHYWCPNGSFKAQFPHTAVCISLWIESFETFTVFIYHQDLIKKGWKRTSYTIWPFYWLINMTQNGNRSFPAKHCPFCFNSVKPETLLLSS